MKDLGKLFNLKVLVKKLFPYLPLSYTDIVARFLKGCKSVLDVGCGNGELMINLRKRINVYSVGLELYLPYLHEAKKRKSHDDYIGRREVAPNKAKELRWGALLPSFGAFEQD